MIRPAEVAAIPFPEDRFVTLRDVPVLVEHETVTRSGRPLRFGPEELAAVAERCNRRIEESGDYAAVSIGHTSESAEKQPEVIGFAGPFRVGRFGKKRAILADFHIFREEAEKLKKYPRRSPELWLEEDYREIYMDPIALLGAEAPRLDMGLLLYRARRNGRVVDTITAKLVAPASGVLFTNCA